MGSGRSRGYLDSVGDVLEASVRDLEERKSQGVPRVGGWWGASWGGCGQQRGEGQLAIRSQTMGCSTQKWDNGKGVWRFSDPRLGA